MFVNIEEAVNWVMNRRRNDSSFEHFKEVMETLGNPQNNFYTIHVAGTDGKGSTVTFLRDLLMSHGYKVGTLQSPHYIVHQDRIRVNNVNIKDDSFINLLNKNYDLIIKENLGMFEIDYLIMCDYFAQEKIDYAIIEVGIGGRLDSTNVIDNTKLSIITTIGYDHMDRLGDTLEKICYEKCGIIKQNSKTLIGHLNDSCKEVVSKVCDSRNNQLYVLDNYLDKGDRKFVYNNNEYELLSFAKYQMHNASLALKAFELLSIDCKFSIDYGLAKQAIKASSWPNRFELVKSNPNVILDGAHNIHGVSALVESIDYLKGSKIIIFSALKRKEYQKMLDLLISHCDELIITTFDNNEVIDLNEFNNYHVNSNYIDAINYGIKNYDNIIICGSLYFLSDVVLNYKFK